MSSSTIKTLVCEVIMLSEFRLRQRVMTFWKMMLALQKSEK